MPVNAPEDEQHDAECPRCVGWDALVAERDQLLEALLVLHGRRQETRGGISATDPDAVRRAFATLDACAAREREQQ